MLRGALHLDARHSACFANALRTRQGARPGAACRLVSTTPCALASRPNGAAAASANVKIDILGIKLELTPAIKEYTLVRLTGRCTAPLILKLLRLTLLRVAEQGGTRAEPLQQRQPHRSRAPLRPLPHRAARGVSHQIKLSRGLADTRQAPTQRAEVTLTAGAPHTGESLWPLTGFRQRLLALSQAR